MANETLSWFRYAVGSILSEFGTDKRTQRGSMLLLDPSKMTTATAYFHVLGAKAWQAEVQRIYSSRGQTVMQTFELQQNFFVRPPSWILFWAPREKEMIPSCSFLCNMCKNVTQQGSDSTLIIRPPWKSRRNGQNEYFCLFWLSFS